MYELLIQDTEKNWQLADLGEDLPAMNYQSNDVAELKDRQADYSQALKLPMSNKNVAIFGFSDIADCDTNLSYQRNDCRLYCNGYVLAGKGSYIILDKVTRYLETQILSGNANFFDILKEKTMEELDLGSFMRNTTSMNPANFGEYYCFAASTFTRGAVNTLQMNPALSFPFVYYGKILDKIVESSGFTLVKNISDDVLNKYAIPVVNILPDEDSFENFNALAEGWGFTSVGWGYYLAFTVENSGINSLVAGQAEEPTAQGPYWVDYIPPADGEIKISYNGEIFSDESNPVITFSIINLSDNEVLATVANKKVAFEQIFSVSKGQALRITQVTSGIDGIGGTGLTPTYSYDLNITDVKFNVVPVGGKVYISKNLGFDTQYDFFKTFVQLFGITINVDHSGKIVYAYTMEKLYSQKSKAIDWSKKLHISNERQTEFTLGSYAQQNNILFKENSDDDITDSGYFLIKNTTLAKSKDLFTIDFESGINRLLVVENQGRYIANIPLNTITYDKETEKEKIEFKEGKPHLVELSHSTHSVNVEGQTYKYQLATHPGVQSFIDTHYDKLANKMLNKAKVIEEEFLLTEEDIEQFDQFTPVYLTQYGAYYYVNKIRNFQSGKLTKCELIRL